MPRPSNTEERRRQIAEGLRKAMAKNGFDGASIADIARAARVPSGIVHYHFDDKREILLELLGTLAAEHDARMDAAIAAAGAHPTKRLRALLEANLAIGKTADPLALACWVQTCAEAIKDPVVRVAWDRALEGTERRLIAILRDGVARKTFRPRASVNAAAAALLALVQGYFVVAATARERIPRGSAFASARAMATGLLGSKGGVL